MKSYPSISKTPLIGEKVYAFDKLDGTNIRAEWNIKDGFYKFGTKNNIINENTPVFGEAIGLIKSKYEKDLTEIFKKEKQKEVLCFFEFYGPNSFAGNHEDEPHTVTLIDVNFYKQGIMPPADFIDLFYDLDIPKVLYYGEMNKTIERWVKEGILENMTFEGVVCKSQCKHPQLKFFKIKNQDWLDKLKTYCKDNDELFEKLA